MASLNFNISIDLGALAGFGSAINREVLPKLHQAVRTIAQQTAADWQAEVGGAGSLWSGERDSYVKSITWRMTGDFSAVIESDYKYAAEIETGRPPRDLKRMLDTSKKVRRTESGKRFLVIPMRHNMKKLQSAGIYGMAKALEPSRIVGKGRRASGEVTSLVPGQGMVKSDKQTPYLSNRKTKSAYMVRQNSYAWGQKLSNGALKGADVGRDVRKWAQGMYRFDTSTPGGAKSSAYLTFRMMMEGSSGWIIPARPGIHLARKVTDNMRPKAQAAFAMAVKKSIGN